MCPLSCGQLHSTAHERTQYSFGLLIKGLPEYLRHGQDDVAIDNAFMQHPTDLTDPVVDVDFGAAQAERRLTTHRDLMGALPTMQTPILDIPYPLRLAACEHLVHKAVIVARIVTWIDVLEPVPVLSKDLFEDVPGRQGFCSHQAASLRGVELCGRTFLSHPANHIYPIIGLHSGTVPYSPRSYATRL